MLLLCERQQEAGSLNQLVLDIERWVVYDLPVFFSELFPNFITFLALVLLVAHPVIVRLLRALSPGDLVVTILVLVFESLVVLATYNFRGSGLFGRLGRLSFVFILIKEQIATRVEVWNLES